MAYCGPRGLALDSFLAWPESSQQAALAWQRHEDARCKGCGTHADDWLDDDGRRHSVARMHWHEAMCFGCAERQRAMDAVHRDTPGVVLMAASGPSVSCTCSD